MWSFCQEEEKGMSVVTIGNSRKGEKGYQKLLGGRGFDLRPSPDLGRLSGHSHRLSSTEKGGVDWRSKGKGWTREGGELRCD